MRAAPDMEAAPADGPGGASEGRTAMGCGPTATTTTTPMVTADHGPQDPRKMRKLMWGGGGGGKRRGPEPRGAWWRRT
eukprot:8911129-Pyramimonas_sp.AAC.1